MLVLALLAMLAGVVVAYWLTGQNQVSGLSAGTAVDAGARPLPEFSLIDQDGTPFGRERFQGHWTYLFFGYTHCPDICPTTLSVLKQAMHGLDTQHENETAQVVFVSVDPERDSPARLGEYTRYFDPRFIGATGDAEGLKQLAASLGIVFAKLPATDGNPADYLMDHGASILLIGPDASLRAVFSPPFVPDALASDLINLRHRP